jgi:glycosyltransferase involved in cell wall biosynthesis
MSDAAPKVLVVARFRDEAAASALSAQVAAQTFAPAELVFVHDSPRTPVTAETLRFCRQDRLEAFVSKSADFVLFWPEDGDLQPAAIEKLVIALSLAPDQVAVADAARGSTGLWLARCRRETLPLLSLWVTSQFKWIEWCLEGKPALFHIDENLSTLEDTRRPFGVEDCFGKLPPRWASLQAIPSDPLWEIAPAPEAKSVLFLVHNLPMGGACKFILDVTAQLVERGYRVTVATTSVDRNERHPWLGELLRLTPHVFNLAHARPADLPRQIVHLARAHRCGRLVISHSMLAYHLLPWLRVHLPEVAFLDYTHIEYETEWPDGGFALRSVQSRSLLDLAVVSSDHLRDWMTDHGTSNEMVRVCHTNIDTRRWTPSEDIREQERAALEIGDAAMILYACRLMPQKRPELLVNILAELERATKRPFVLVIAGDGPLMEPLQAFIQREKLEHRVRVLGAVKLDRMARLHNAADIFLLPSLIEGISLALFESMALESVPVVADVGGQRELVTPECGELISHASPLKEVAAYVSALKFLIEDPEQRRAMANACRRRVETHFQLGQMASRFEAALDEASRRHVQQPCLLPPPELAQSLAALTIDHVRAMWLASDFHEAAHLMAGKVSRAERAVEKLTRQVQAMRPRRAA